MVKVFQLITSVNLGGAENVAFNLSELCTSKASKPIEFIIVELHRSGGVYAKAKRVELKEKGIRTINLFKGGKHLSLIIAPFILLWNIKKESPRIIHSHTDLPDLVLATTIRFMRIFGMKTPKIIRTIHNTELWPTYPTLAKYTETAYGNDTIIGVSKAALQAYYNIRKKTNLSISPNSKVVYNGCKLPDKMELTFIPDPEKINIAFCGRLELQKGIDILIERIKAINLNFSNKFHFYIIGNGSYKGEVNKLALGNDNITVFEAIPLIANKLHYFDFVLMPSRFEGLPLLAIEASFSKVPLIASWAPGINETLPENWPLWFRLEDEQELLAIIEKIVNGSYDLQHLKEVAFEFVEQHFSMKKMIEEYSMIYSDLSND